MRRPVPLGAKASACRQQGLEVAPLHQAGCRVRERPQSAAATAGSRSSTAKDMPSSRHCQVLAGPSRVAGGAGDVAEVRVCQTGERDTRPLGR